MHGQPHIRFTFFFFSFFLSYSYLFYLLIVGAEGYCCTWSHSMTLTQYNSSERVIGTFLGPLPSTHNINKRQPCLRRHSNPQSQQASGLGPRRHVDRLTLLPYTSVFFKYCKQHYKQMRRSQMCYYLSFPKYFGVIGLLSHTHGYHSNSTSRFSDFYMSY